MAVPNVTFIVEPVIAAPAHHLDEVIFVVGVTGTGGAGVPGELVYGANGGDFDASVGTDGDLHEFITDLYSKAEPDMVVSFYITDKVDPNNIANRIDQTPAELIISIEEALALVDQANHKPTVLHVAGDATAPGNSPDASEIVTMLETICERLECRAVANAAQDTIANGIAWGLLNGKPRVMGVFNQDITSAGNQFPAGHWLGAVLAVSGDNGRAWGINYAAVPGVTQLLHPLTIGSTSDLTSLDANGVSSIVVDEGLFEIIGDEFKTASEEDPQRFWSVGRVVDHVERTLTQFAHQFVGSTRSADRVAVRLTEALNPIIDGGEILSGSVVADSEREQGVTKNFILELEILYATNILNVRTRFSG